MKQNDKFDRRHFLKSASAATAAALTAPVTLAPFDFFIGRSRAQNRDEDHAKVVVVRDLTAHQGSQIMADVAQVMMDEAVRRYTGILDVGDAYKSLFLGIGLTSIIGVKVNCINPSLSTHPIVVEALTNGLQEMTFSGMPFPANNIIVWDRTSSELQAAGYTINSGTVGVRCFGTNTVGYNNAVALNCAGYTEYPSRILTDYADYLINVAVMKNAGGCGLTMTLKNNYGCINAPSQLHDTFCDPYIPAVNQQLRDVLDVQESLYIVDAIFGCVSGGPTGPPNLIYDGILLSQDRVAADAVGRSILDEYGCLTLAGSVHVDTASQAPYNLGISNLDLISRVDVLNPSAPVQNLRDEPSGNDIRLIWSAPAYTGFFIVQRSLDPNFATFQQIAQVSANQYLDVGALLTAEKYFYRVVKTW